MKRRYTILITMLLTSLTQAFGQSYWSYDDHGISLKMPEVSLVTVMPTNYTVNLSMGLPIAAGAKPGIDDDAMDDNTWLNYSCSVSQHGGNRKVYAQITSGVVPEGVELELQVKNLNKPGRGKWGRRYRSKTILTNQPQVVVYRIGGGCTRRGKSYGHQLIYRLKLKDIDDLAIKEPKTYLTITYTISD
ncbi:MAG: hypothetical protein JJ975_15075 [Bacteroidia bacterium]|nr:hypothetical protein [Bacteroidia bacterium]